MPNILVFFGSGRYSRPRPIPAWIRLRLLASVAKGRISRRHVRAVLADAVRVLSRSDVAHVAIGCRGVVLEVGLNGAHFASLLAYAAMNPTLVGVVEVPVRELPDIDGGTCGSVRVGSTLLRVITFGLWPSNDCVSIARNLLAESGVHVPRGVLSPGKLRAWLIKQGFKYAPFEAAVANGDAAGCADPERDVPASDGPRHERIEGPAGAGVSGRSPVSRR